MSLGGISKAFNRFVYGQSGGMSLLPQYASPPRPGGDEHDLDELSPRPGEALLATQPPDRGGGRPRNANAPNRETSFNISSNSHKGKAKTSVTIQEPPRSPSRDGDGMETYMSGRRSFQHRQAERAGPGNSRTPHPGQHRDLDAPNTGPRMPFWESMFVSRADPNADRPHSNVDRTFRTIHRRERQLEKELQDLLDAQSYALERNLYSISQEEDSQRSRTPDSEVSTGQVMPVRQPRKRRLTKKEARIGIARVMNEMSDLKDEEEAYIAAALAERKGALSRLRNLTTQRKSITAEMRTIEHDREQPAKSRIRDMERAHDIVCDEIDKTEKRLRQLKRDKTSLERKLQEAKSTVDSELSGYKGALRECDRKIAEIMGFPGVQVLEVEDLVIQHAELRSLIGEHITGFEFLGLRPERRTMPMAKDWWEGELRILEVRKTAVDRERAALDEGSQLWQDALELLDSSDARLKTAFGLLSQYSYDRPNAKLQEPADVLVEQYRHCAATITKLLDMVGHAEKQRWNPLVIALGAEGAFCGGLKQHLAETLEILGRADGVVTPPPPPSPPPTSSSSKTPKPSDGDAATAAEEQAGERGGIEQQGADEELSGSVIRRWAGVEDDDDDSAPHERPSDLLLSGGSAGKAGRRDVSYGGSSNNEVPPGLLTESSSRRRYRDESEEEEEEMSRHTTNEVPAEFLSTHTTDTHDSATIAGEFVRSGNVEGEGDAGGDGGEGGGGGREEEEPGEARAELHELSRESSANEVPPDLLSESRRDDVD
ncbi:hypothetical protein GGR56DRAFT_647790 [Xylariaceae sp. FL0804]|nr:hypothetical protein GGR56DRAFT_647790 [Xylariaceae sp. FL0804]